MKIIRYKSCHSRNIYILLEMYIFFVSVYLKQRTDTGLRLTIKSERFSSSGKALMTYEQWVLDNKDKQGLIVELQFFENGGRCVTLQEKHM